MYIKTTRPKYRENYYFPPLFLLKNNYFEIAIKNVWHFGWYLDDSYRSSWSIFFFFLTREFTFEFSAPRPRAFSALGCMPCPAFF